mgnify:FL=1|jgi:Pirin-related protein
MGHIKPVVSVHKGGEPHWVGDGFPVRSIFSHRGQGADISPFLLLDYGGPVEVAPTTVPRGVGEHPHKGFETVTIVYRGEIAHRDSSGGRGVIGPGDVQWMTAGSGLVHEEMYSPEFARTGGTLEFLQLWVNLPARDKAAPPGYQTLLAADIPTVDLGSGGATARVIAGELAGRRGPARTFSPVNVWDIRLPAAGARVELPVPEGDTTLVVLTRGAVTLNGGQETLAEAEFAQFDRAGDAFTVEATVGETSLLVLTGQPIHEPIAAYGPFVMNTREEISAALSDYHTGKMGHL